MIDKHNIELKEGDHIQIADGSVYEIVEHPRGGRLSVHIPMTSSTPGKKAAIFYNLASLIPLEIEIIKPDQIEK